MSAGSGLQFSSKALGVVAAYSPKAKRVSTIIMLLSKKFIISVFSFLGEGKVTCLSCASCHLQLSGVIAGAQAVSIVLLRRCFP